ncbi:hypothetical protein SCALM49S_03327 [Streptomyces californicus]
MRIAPGSRQIGGLAGPLERGATVAGLWAIQPVNSANRDASRNAADRVVAVAPAARPVTVLVWVASSGSRAAGEVDWPSMRNWSNCVRKEVSSGSSAEGARSLGLRLRSISVPVPTARTARRPTAPGPREGRTPAVSASAAAAGSGPMTRRCSSPPAPRKAPAAPTRVNGTVRGDGPAAGQASVGVWLRRRAVARKKTPPRKA